VVIQRSRRGCAGTPARAILETISFRALILGNDPAIAPVGSLATRQFIEQARHVIRKGREGQAGIRQSFAEARQNLRRLARLNGLLAVGLAQMIWLR